MRPISIDNGQVLHDHGLARSPLHLAEGRIAAHADTNPLRIDATGLRVLPGIVDIHGDAFERQFQPRPGVGFPTDLALAETERQLLANGITTAFHGVTLSWEPGLRSLTAWRTMLDGLAARPWAVDMRVHLRWEAYNLDALDTAIADIAAGRVHLLAFNDHTPAILRHLDHDTKAAKYADRAGMNLPQFRALAQAVGARAADVPAAQTRIAAAARAAGIPMASHDDDTIPCRDAFRAIGAAICEFPMAEDVGRAARTAGDAVIMGSPNVVRGGSHLGWASAAKMAEAGVCNVLSSDYYYPCMPRAAVTLARRGVLDFAQSWALISRNPALAGALPDRGSLAEGQRADVVLMDASDTIVCTIAAGRMAYLADPGILK